MYLSIIKRFNVSYNVLSSVPWAGTSRLVSIMDQVVQRGPNDQKTWSTMIRRADLILESFSSNNLSRMVVLMTKSPFSDPLFLEKLKSQSLKKVEESDLLSCCGFLFGLSKMGLCDGEILSEFSKRVTDQLSSAKGSYPLVLILNVYCNSKDKTMAKQLLTEIKNHMDSLKPQSYAMILVDVLSNFSDSEVLSSLDPFLLNSINFIKDMDLRSLVHLYTVFSQTEHPLRTQYLQNLARHLTGLTHHASLHQISLLLKAYSRCLVDTEFLQSLLNSLSTKYETGDLQELLFLLSHLLKLNLRGLGLTQQLMDKIVTFKNINGVQLSNIVYLSGKFALQIPQSFILDHFQRSKRDFTLKDLALFSYGLDKLGLLESIPDLPRIASEMLIDHENHNTRAHLMLKRTFNQLN